MISPAMYCEFFKPRHKILWCRAKELAEIALQAVAEVEKAVVKCRTVLAEIGFLSDA
jgi:hypothetical protein